MGRAVNTFRETLEEMEVKNIQDIPEGFSNLFSQNGFENTIPFDAPSSKTLEERQNDFVKALNEVGITDIKDIPQGCYQPQKDRQEVWVVK